MIEKYILKILKNLSSLKLAVINLISLGVISAVGTIIESKYDLYISQELVYRSIWMKLVLASLSLNLFAVLCSRWPWKKKHIPFVTAHFGILILIAGSLMTQTLGVDGSMRIEPQETKKSIILPERIISVYSSFVSGNVSNLYKSRPRFVLNPPSESKPYKIFLGSETMEITDYYPYARERLVFKPNKNSGLLVRFRLSGERATFSDSIYKTKVQNFVMKQAGPAFIVLSQGSYTPQKSNELILNFKNSKQLQYQIVKNKKVRKAGFIQKGESFRTGWMDLKFHLIDFYKAERMFEFQASDSSDEYSHSALKVKFQGKERWTRLNASLYFYSKNSSYIFNYMNQIKSIGASVRLLDFKIKKYPGNFKAKEYQSLVQVDGGEPVLISMNEPLKYKGWTFYQSGFEEDKEGKTVASILAVNRDPGRWVKYLGSFLIVLGVFLLFYMRRPKYG